MLTPLPQEAALIFKLQMLEAENEIMIHREGAGSAGRCYRNGCHLGVQKQPPRHLHIREALMGDEGWTGAQCTF